MPRDHKRSDVEELPVNKTVRMSVAEAAEMIGVCEQTVRNMANAGIIAWFWGSGKIRPSGVMASSVRDFISRKRTTENHASN